VIAFAVISTIILDVTGGAVMMWHIRGDNAAFYRVTSTIAVVLLILPLMTLASSAAKLSARRRDDRLSSLRLIGASAHLLRVMTLPVIGVIAALVLLALTSSAIGLRRVDVSPLGVRMRSQPTSVSWVRLVVGGIMLLLIVFSRKILGFLGSQAGTIGGYIFVIAFLTIVVEIANIIGPKLLSMMWFTHRLRKARNATELIAARQVLENPRAAWTQVASLGAVCVVGMFGGTGAAFMQLFGSGPDADEVSRTIGRDVQTGVMLLILFAFATVACSVGVNQAAAILDRRQVEVVLDVVGMDLTAQDKARRITVLSPMRFAMAIGLIATGLLLIPLVGMALLARPVAVITIVGTILLGAGMVRLGLWSTRPLLGRVLDDGLARTE
ncbi:MAG: ABC transporter permease, partial [Cutibacterium acnes]